MTRTPPLKSILFKIFRSAKLAHPERSGETAKITLGGLAARLKRKLQLPAIEIIGAPKRPVSSVAVCAGSAGRLPLESSRARGADVIVTGEVHHHDRLTYARLGKSAVILGHCNSERPVLPHLRDKLVAAVPKLTVRIASADGPPAVWR